MKNAICLIFCLFCYSAFYAQSQAKSAGRNSHMQNIHKLVDILNHKGEVKTMHAKGRQLAERLIAQSTYSDTVIQDSSHYIYSGSRSSYFSYNYMAYTNFYNLDGSYIFGFGADIGFLDHNDNPSMLSDTTMIWGYDPIAFTYGLLQTWYMVYDLSNNIITSSQYADSTINPYIHFENTFDNNDNIATSVAMDWTGAQWDSSELRIFIYDNNHLLIKDSTSLFNGTSWQPLEKWIYTRDVNGNVTLADYYYFDGTNWINDHRYEMTYFNGTNLITLSDESYDGANWQTNTKDIFGYNGTEPYCVSYTETNFYLGYLVDSSIYTKHISGGLPDTLYNDYYDGYGNLYNRTFTAFEYDTYDEPTTAYQYYYDTATQAYDSTAARITYYYYETYNKPSVVTAPKETAAIKMYPNPVTNQLFLDLSAVSGTCNIQLIDCYGRQLSRISASGQASISMQQLPAGLYWVIISNERGEKLKSGKIIKQ